MSENVFACHARSSLPFYGPQILVNKIINLLAILESENTFDCHAAKHFSFHLMWFTFRFDKNNASYMPITGFSMPSLSLARIENKLFRRRWRENVSWSASWDEYFFSFSSYLHARTWAYIMRACSGVQNGWQAKQIFTLAETLATSPHHKTMAHTSSTNSGAIVACH